MRLVCRIRDEGTEGEERGRWEGWEGWEVELESRMD